MHTVHHKQTTPVKRGGLSVIPRTTPEQRQSYTIRQTDRYIVEAADLKAYAATARPVGKDFFLVHVNMDYTPEEHAEWIAHVLRHILQGRPLPFYCMPDEKQQRRWWEKVRA